MKIHGMKYYTIKSIFKLIIKLVHKRLQFPFPSITTPLKAYSKRANENNHFEKQCTYLNLLL